MYPLLKWFCVCYHMCCQRGSCTLKHLFLELSASLTVLFYTQLSQRGSSVWESRMSNVSVYLTCCRAFKNLPVNLCSTLSPTHTPDLQISQGWHSVSCSSAFTDISYFFFSIKCAMLYCFCAKPVSYSQQWAILTAGLHIHSKTERQYIFSYIMLAK